MRTLPKFLGVMSALLALGLAGAASAQSRNVSWLGVYSQEITPELRDGLSYNGEGVVIQRIVTDSPAEAAGLRRGDVIVRVGDREIGSPNELASVVRSYSPGRRVRIEFVREGRRQSTEARLETRRNSDDSIAPQAPEPPAVPRVPSPAPEAQSWEFDDNGHGHDDVMLDLRSLTDLKGMGSLLGRGRMGVRVESLNPELASYFGSRDTRGALVIEVVDESAADKADLRPGDVITRVEDRRIETAEDLVAAIGEQGAGELSVSYIRHGRRETAEVDLESSPRVMRMRGGPGFRWNSRDMRSPKRIVVRDDVKDDEQLRGEIDDLKKELEQLRRELDEKDED